MAATNFTTLLAEQKLVWQRDVWTTARQKSFIMSQAGSDMNSVFQRITELTPTERGDQAIITLVPDLEEDGAMGDTQLWDNEEAIKALDQSIYIDQIRHANRTTGKMADQKSIVKFRETSKNVLAFWLADRVDQMAFLTLSGIDPRLHTNGSARQGFTFAVDGADKTSWTSLYPRESSGAGSAGRALVDLEFFTGSVVGDRVKAPTANRPFRWVSSSGSLEAAGTSSIVATDTPSYRMLVELKAYAKDKRIRPISGDEGRELYHVYMHPKALAKLKLDADFLANLRSAGQRGSSNSVFTGAIETIDGMVIHENTHVFNTLGARTGAASATASAAGDTAADWAGAIGHKWGANASVNGSRTLILGAQALAFADLGMPSWEEDDWDYKNQLGISVGKILGFMKPQWFSPMDNAIADIATAKEDYGVICVDHAI
jgi:N4-gp56 family major capsid protein